MAVTIKGERSARTLPSELMRILPPRLSDEIRKRFTQGDMFIEEIRMRSGRVSPLTSCGRNILLQTVLTQAEVDSFFGVICEGSLYAHSETINNGYVTLDGGIRVGICGSASVSNSKIMGVHSISSLNVRIPHTADHIGEPVCRMLRSYSGSKGILIYSPPGEGKTTLLRSVCAKMAGGENPLRVCVIDTRGELSASLNGQRLCIDVLSGYPRGIGIEIATRTLNAQLIVCDEIGGVAEAEAIIAAQNCGVPFLASAHASSVAELLHRTGVHNLHKAQVFGCYVGIRRRTAGDLAYTFTEWEEADAVLQYNGSIDGACVRN